jgi:hypothetical protein
MAEEVNINISITTNAAPVASKITKELQGVRKEAKAVKDDLKRHHRACQARHKGL